MIAAMVALACLQETDPRQDLQRILERPEFRENLPSDFWENLRQYLKLKEKQINVEPPDPPKPPTISIPAPPEYTLSLMKVLFIIAMAILAAFIILMLYKAFAKKSDEEEAPAAPETAAAPEAVNALSQSADQWAGDAEKLFREGKIAEAIRALYLAILSASHRRGWIDYNPGKTNGEYIRKFRGPMEGEERLRGITLVYERKWYGKETGTARDYEESRRLASEMIRLKEEPA